MVLSSIRLVDVEDAADVGVAAGFLVSVTAPHFSLADGAARDAPVDVAALLTRTILRARSCSPSAVCCAAALQICVARRSLVDLA